MQRVFRLLLPIAQQPRTPGPKGSAVSLRAEQALPNARVLHLMWRQLTVTPSLAAQLRPQPCDCSSVSGLKGQLHQPGMKCEVLRSLSPAALTGRNDDPKVHGT